MSPGTVRVTLHGSGPDIAALGIFLEAVTKGHDPAGVLAKLRLAAITITETRGTRGRASVITMMVELRETPGRDVTVRTLREALGLPELPHGKDGQ